MIWIVAHFSLDLPDDRPFWVVMSVTVVNGVVFAIRLRLSALAIASTLLLVIPPFAPIVMCHLLSSGAFAVARRRGEGDLLVPVLLRSGSGWLRTGHLAVMMMVVALYYYAMALEHHEHTVRFLLTDPLRLMRDAFAPMLKCVFLALAFWYAVQVMRTMSLLRFAATAPIEQGTALDDPAG